MAVEINDVTDKTIRKKKQQKAKKKTKKRTKKKKPTVIVIWNLLTTLKIKPKHTKYISK